MRNTDLIRLAPLNPTQSLKERDPQRQKRAALTMATLAISNLENDEVALLDLRTRVQRRRCGS